MKITNMLGLTFADKLKNGYRSTYLLGGRPGARVGVSMIYIPGRLDLPVSFMTGADAEHLDVENARLIVDHELLAALREDEDNIYYILYLMYAKYRVNKEKVSNLTGQAFYHYMSAFGEELRNAERVVEIRPDDPMVKEMKQVQ